MIGRDSRRSSREQSSRTDRVDTRRQTASVRVVPRSNNVDRPERHGPIRVLLVDDSAVIRGLLTRIIEAESDMKVAGTAGDGEAGLRKIESIKPDVVILDIEMPNTDGLQALVRLRRVDRRLPVIMFSSLTERGATATMDALAKGASDYVAKPSGAGTISEGMAKVSEDLLGKIRALVGTRARPESTPLAARLTRRLILPSVDAVVIGCSTGGPPALETVLGAWTQPLPIPVLIVQHMPPIFTKALADRLSRKSAAAVVEAAHGMKVEAGTCYIAPGGRHMEVAGSPAGGAEIVINDGPPENSCRPSVDPLFRSASRVYGRNLLAAMLTGMGQDGLEGTRVISGLGCPVLVQDEESSVVWGMPGAVVEADLATEVLPLNEMGPRLAQLSPRRVARSSTVGGA